MLFKWAASLSALLATLQPGSALPVSSGAGVSNALVPRNVIYIQTFTNPDGSQLSLLPLLNQPTRVTHVILAALHVDSTPGEIHLNNNDPSSSFYDFLWPEVQQLQQAGIKVMMMLGGAARGSYQNLATNFDTYYPPMLQALRNHNIDGLDLDVEEDVSIEALLQLSRQLVADMGENFILTSAPVASAMFRTGGSNLNNVSYFDLDTQANDTNRPNGKLINWYNIQAYNGWGSASTTFTYDNVIQSGWAPSRIVLGVPDSPADASGWVPLTQLGSVITALRQGYSDFGGVVGWEYYDAGTADGLANPWQWVQQIGSDLFGALQTSLLPNGIHAAVQPVSPFEAELADLVSKGVSFGDAVTALNKTNGDLSSALSLVHVPSLL